MLSLVLDSLERTFPDTPPESDEEPEEPKMPGIKVHRGLKWSLAEEISRELGA